MCYSPFCWVVEYLTQDQEMPENFGEEPQNGWYGSGISPPKWFSTQDGQHLWSSWAPLPHFDPCPNCEVLKRTARSAVRQGILLARQKAPVADFGVFRRQSKEQILSNDSNAYTNVHCISSHQTFTWTYCFVACIWCRWLFVLDKCRYTAGIQSVRHVDTVDTVYTRNQTQKVQGHLQDWLNSLNFRAQLVASPVGVKLFISKKLEKTSKAGEGGNFSVKPTNQLLAEVVVCRIFLGFKMFKVEQLENADRTLDCDLPNGCQF